ncbi:MAG: Fic family protein [Deltaproteobacteria bacterium]|uniref:Fic family protein n=1 Tax=Candidatus Methanogaster sp. TaxID=3386292 RepID=A0AC61L0Y1_9EURY|nr:MAG: Fic family protein [ANME-2 cluster archaeon]PXF60316.1 MAG: Fic family protein [Deltaproteobacteria bacterium]
MDVSKFTEEKTGKLVPVNVPEKDWAFTPDPLPPKWQFPASLWPLLSKARESLARLDGIGRTLPNPELLLHPLQSREALRSSSLEGTYASPQQLLLFELEPREPKSESDPANAWLEVSNYGRALRQGMHFLQRLPLCLRLIRELHKTLLTGVRGKDKAPGEFRKLQVQIGSDRRFIPPPANYLPACLDAFEKRLNQEDLNYDPLVRCYMLHYQFEAIHPFIDGNGRVGRVLLSLMVYKWCDLTMPWLYMSAFFEQYKDEYIDNLFRVSSRGEWERWIEFCLRGTVAHAEDSVRRCDALRILKERYIQKAGGLSVRAHTIIDDLFTSPVLRIPDVAKKYSITYPTAKTDVQGLVKEDVLQEIEDIRPRTFFSPDIFEIAYGE